MKHKFNHNGKIKTVNIDDQWLDINRKNLGITEQEAIELWLCDEGYITNEVIEELTARAKAVGIDHDITPKRKGAVNRTPDLTRQAIIDILYSSLWNFNGELPFNKKITNLHIDKPERLISFTIGNDSYEITLSKKRLKQK